MKERTTQVLLAAVVLLLLALLLRPASVIAPASAQEAGARAEYTATVPVQKDSMVLMTNGTGIVLVHVMPATGGVGTVKYLGDFTPR